MSAGLFWTVFVLVAMGWFALGWVARGQENRKYAESRPQHLTADAVLDTQAQPIHAEVERAPVPVAIAPVIQPVVHVHVGAAAQAPAPLPRVIDARELEQ
jgi:hypothetical protein